jgi:hypothetical protein
MSHGQPIGPTFVPGGVSGHALSGAAGLAATDGGGGGLLELHATIDNMIAPARASLLVEYISHLSLIF